MTGSRILLAFVEDEVEDVIATALRGVPDTFERAEFVEGEDEDGTPYIGVEYPISADDREEFDRVSGLVDALCEVSVLGCDIVLELDDEEIGEIQQGAMTPGVRFDLLSAWEERLPAS